MSLIFYDICRGINIGLRMGIHAKINVVCAFNVQHKISLNESNVGNGDFVLFRYASFAMFKLHEFSKHVMKNEDLMLTPRSNCSRWRKKTVHVVFYVFVQKPTCRKGAGKAGGVTPPPLSYFPAEPWIFQLKTT
jgi:hypothetical protein